MNKLKSLLRSNPLTVYSIFHKLPETKTLKGSINALMAFMTTVQLANDGLIIEEIKNIIKKLLDLDAGIVRVEYSVKTIPKFPQSDSA